MHSFRDVPFGDADNLLFCQIFYMPFERVVSESFAAEPVPFPTACNDVFASRGYQHKKLGLMIPADGSHNIMRMAVQPRFAEMKLVGVKEVLSAEPAVQFGAGTFLLPDGTMVIVYRGTDDTILGWKEDLDIFARKEIPSYALALDYLEKAAARPSLFFVLTHRISNHTKSDCDIFPTICEPPSKKRRTYYTSCVPHCFRSRNFKNGSSYSSACLALA